jgi:hypothetical protein
VIEQMCLPRKVPRIRASWIGVNVQGLAVDSSLPVQPPSAAEPETEGGGVGSSATSEKAKVVPSQVK